MMSSTTRSTCCAANSSSASSPSRGLDNRVAVLLEREREDPPHGVFVVDEQDRGGGIRASVRARCQDSPAMAATRAFRAAPARGRGAGRSSAPSTHASTAARSSSLALPLLVLAFSVVRPARCRRRSCRRASTARGARALAVDLATRYPDRVARQRRRDAGGAVVPRRRCAVRLAGRARPWHASVPGLGQRAAAEPVGGRRRASRATRSSWSPIATTRGSGPGANDDARGTAALDRARAQVRAADTPAGQRVRSAHTIVFLSTDGGAFGGLGAARFAAHAAVPRRRGDRPRRDRGAGPAAHRHHRRHAALAAAALVETAAQRVLEQTGTTAGAHRASSASSSTSASRSRSTSRGRSSRAVFRR